MQNKSNPSESSAPPEKAGADDGSLTLPGDLQALSPIRKYVRTAAEKAGIDQTKSYRLVLAIDEVVANTVIHGYQEAGLTGDVRVHAELVGDELRVTVEDSALAFDPRSVPRPPDMDLGAENRSIGGLGVYLALEGVDRFEYERVGDRNRSVFVLNRTGDRPKAS
jgi:serine/threonine-protein kinase RsbW